MDILDNIMYANLLSKIQQEGSMVHILSEYIDPFQVAPGIPQNTGTPGLPLFSYDLADKMDYCAYADTIDIEKSITRHWFDINKQVNYDRDAVRPINTPPPPELIVLRLLKSAAPII